MEKFTPQTLTAKQRRHNASVAQKNYRLKLQKKGYRAFQRYIPNAVHPDVTRLVDDFISKYKKKKVS